MLDARWHRKGKNMMHVSLIPFHYVFSKIISWESFPAGVIQPHTGILYAHTYTSLNLAFYRRYHIATCLGLLTCLLSFESSFSIEYSWWLSLSWPESHFSSRYHITHNLEQTPPAADDSCIYWQELCDVLVATRMVRFGVIPDIFRTFWGIVCPRRCLFPRIISKGYCTVSRTVWCIILLGWRLLILPDCNDRYIFNSALWCLPTIRLDRSDLSLALLRTS